MNLLEFRKDVYSSTGNDGIIEKIFEILQIKNGVFVEFGAWDGIKGSNCRKLFEEGWSGVFIEPDKPRYQSLEENYRQFENISCINSPVGFGDNSFDTLVAGQVEDNFDFCSIDIDGLDLEIFETFQAYMPKVVCIEGGQMLQPFHTRVPEIIAARNVQQSLQTMIDSFRERGYRLLCTYQDSFFVKEEYFDLFDVSEDTMEQYLDGIQSLLRRLPWIQATIGQQGLQNKIVDFILQNSEYNSYGYDKRKIWAVEKEDLAIQNIQKLRDHYSQRYKK